MRHITLLSVACPALIYYSTRSHKGHDLWQKFLNIIFFFIFCTRFVWNISIIRRTQLDVIIKFPRLSYTVSVILMLYWRNLLCRQIWQKYSDIILMSILPVGTELLLVDRHKNSKEKPSRRFSQYCRRT